MMSGDMLLNSFGFRSQWFYRTNVFPADRTKVFKDFKLRKVLQQYLLDQSKKKKKKKKEGREYIIIRIVSWYTL